MARAVPDRNHFAENCRREQVIRPSYGPRLELYLDALESLADLLADYRGSLPAWCLFRCWAEVVLSWAVDDGRAEQ